ncbi:MAG: hypothetical protein MUF32_00755 [Burkholderiaceae bacterium]|jgi:hypothetical protein|nr:hypothetical protein [Burkholderiaceae bacterium]
MSNELIKKTVALAAAASTTLVLFSAVVSIAKEDKVALAAARSVTQVAVVGTPRTVR